MSAVPCWLEVWIDEPSRGAYVLVARGFDDGSVEVLDPQKQGDVIQRFGGYAEARLWLREDEYKLVQGRCVFDWD